MAASAKSYIPAKDVPEVRNYPNLQPLYDAAWQNYGVQLGYFYYDNPYPDSEPKPGYYAIVCPDHQTMGVLQKGIVSLGQVLKDNLAKHPNEVMCYYNAVYLSEIDEKNAFRVVRDIEKAIRNVSTAKYAFTEYGYDLPKSVQQVTLDKFARYNNIRHAKDLPQATRLQYEQVMKKSVAYANELYNKDKGYSGVKLVPKRKNGSQLVDRDYFDKLHISCVNDVVTEEFWRYLQERMPEVPGFVIYKDKKPSLVLEDNSSDKGVFGKNIWSEQKGYKEYNVTFSAGMSNEFYTWMLDFKVDGLKNVLSEEEMLKATDTLMPVQMHFDDLETFDAYCHANGDIRYSINHGLFGRNDDNSVRNPIIGVRREDAPMVGAILKQMTQDGAKDLVYSLDDWQRLDSLPNASYANPYLTEYQKANSGITR